MSDAQSSFNTQLASVMESLLAAAVCEISRIFEGSLSDSRAEVAQGREEVVLLKRKLEALEGRLKEASAVGGTGTGVTFDPSTFAQVLDAGARPPACLLEGAPLPKGEIGPQEGQEVACQVKTELQVKELESVSFTQGCAELDRVYVKEESTGEDLEPQSVETAGVQGVTAQLRPASNMAHLQPASDASPEAVADSTVTWTIIPGAGPSPVLAQKLQRGLSANGLERVPRQLFSSRPGCVVKGRGGIVLGGSTAGGSGYGARTRLRPALSHAQHNGRTHGPAPDHIPKSTPSHAHRTAPDHAPSSSSPAPEGSPNNGWAGETRLACPGGLESPAQPGHPPPGRQEEAAGPQGGFVGSTYATTHSVPAAQRYHLSTQLPAPCTGGAVRGSRPNTCVIAKVKLKHHLTAMARERPYGCPYCGKAFFYPSQQRRHLLRHTGERLYPCAQCEKSFVTPSELSVHIRVHTGEKPYSCLQCGKRFNRTGNLRAHERDVHLGKRPFSCAECGKTFAQKGNLRTHQQRVHQAQRPLPNT
ncbi:hypothetical protein SKAU_G00032170 [Synaphobranchus kaupii]|uniref:C2H2-type domain-containing protein n=1 Tax=Synaphobranchus kaupii TaxID=118154 RepID=A0A9Q1JGA0_SYNKA|nr:hypothetical protein SKAU_G00032170 [Synaphobranchus kaupii]